MPDAFDKELRDLPPEFRRRVSMARIEAAIFASALPVPESDLAKIVPETENPTNLIAAIRAELAPRPYDIVYAAGGWRFQTRPEVKDALAVFLPPERAGPDLSKQDLAILACVAYDQPLTRANISDRLGQEISRDAIRRLRRLNLIDSGPRAPLPGAPVAYVTTNEFLSLFCLASLADLPDPSAA